MIDMLSWPPTSPTLRIVHLVALASLADAGEAGMWKCTNKDTVEIVCTEMACESHSTFTPVALELDGQRISICAYSACFEGAPDVFVRNGAHLLVSDTPNRGSGSNRSPPERLSLALDEQSGTAVLLWRGFAQPLMCRA